jgi:hypothetical protein
MDRGTLAEASYEALLRVADRYGVDVPEDVSRSDLEDLIFEAAEELREEQHRGNNHSVRVEESKYHNREGDEFGWDTSEDIELPDSYNETRIVLLLRDPSWAFAYWDLQASDRDQFKASESFDGLLVRVYSLESPDQSIGNCRASFDIPVTLQDNRWYINLPDRGINYRLALVAVLQGRERLLTVSNTIAVPSGTLNEPVSPASAVASGDEILAQTGIQDMDLPVNGKRIPQRILDLIDEDLVFN